MSMHPRVVILSAFLSPFRSGAEACAEEVAVRMADHYDVTIVTARLRKSLPRCDVLCGRVAVVRVGVGWGIDKWLYPFLAPIAVLRLRPVLVHAVLETFAGLALHLCGWMGVRARRLLTLQTTNRAFLKETVVRSADRVTAISRVLAEEATAWRKEVEVIPNGLDVASFESARRRHEKVTGRVLFVGRLEMMKGVDVLLQAMAAVQKMEPGATQVHLRVVGKGSQRRALEKRAQELGIADRVTFVGPLLGEMLLREYAEAEVFCGLSRSEALGNVFLEAQAGGCAVVATRVGGIPEIVKDGETGLLVAPDDSHAAAEVMVKLLRDVHLRGTMALAGVHHAAGYDWGVIAEKYAVVYGSMLSDSSQ